jgi:hypothetical protein
MIAAARVAAAHEGVAELVVTLRHDNGGCSEVVLDSLGAAALLDACQATAPEELIGHPWQKVRDALAVSWNRFTRPGNGTASRAKE